MKNPNVSAGWREVIEGYAPQDEREAEERRSGALLFSAAALLVILLY